MNDHENLCYRIALEHHDSKPISDNAREARWGNKGSLSIDKIEDRWHDFESDGGGGAPQLLNHLAGIPLNQ